MTTNELVLYFTFDISSITGVLGRGGGKGMDILRRTLRSGGLISIAAKRNLLGVFFLFVCSVSAWACAERAQWNWEDLVSAAGFAHAAVRLSFTTLFRPSYPGPGANPSCLPRLASHLLRSESHNNVNGNTIPFF